MSTSAARRSKRVSAAGASETEESETDDDVRDEEDDAYGELGEVSCSSTISTLTILTGRKNLVSRQFGELRVLISSVYISKNYSRYKHAHRKEEINETSLQENKALLINELADNSVDSQVHYHFLILPRKFAFFVVSAFQDQE